MSMSLITELEELLSEDVASVISREKLTFDQITAPFTQSLVIFGAGGLGRKTLAGLRTVGIEPLAFADNNPNLWNKSVDGLQVLSPQDVAQKFGHQAAFVVAIWSPGQARKFTLIRQQLLELGCLKIVSFISLFWKYSEIFLPYYCIDLPHKVYEQAEDVRSGFLQLADEASQREYLAQLRWRVLIDFDSLTSPIPQEQYFPTDIISLLSHEFFVDCGAFDGDTMRSFIKRQDSSFGNILALEPDPVNFEKLQRYVSTLDSNITNKINLLQLAAGVRKEKVYFQATGTGASSVVDTGTLEVDSVSLDEVLNDSLPTYIKMDIEGAELDALAGAQRLISQANPLLAICVYHMQNHLWKIPLFIHSLGSQYSFFLRPHGEDCLDLVCYAVPIDRLIVK